MTQSPVVEADHSIYLEFTGLVRFAKKKYTHTNVRRVKKKSGRYYKPQSVESSSLIFHNHTICHEYAISGRSSRAQSR